VTLFEGIYCTGLFVEGFYSDKGTKVFTKTFQVPAKGYGRYEFTDKHYASFRIRFASEQAQPQAGVGLKFIFWPGLGATPFDETARPPSNSIPLELQSQPNQYFERALHPTGSAASPDDRIWCIQPGTLKEVAMNGIVCDDWSRCGNIDFGGSINSYTQSFFDFPISSWFIGLYWSDWNEPLTQCDTSVDWCATEHAGTRVEMRMWLSNDFDAAPSWDSRPYLSAYTDVNAICKNNGWLFNRMSDMLWSEGDMFSHQSAWIGWVALATGQLSSSQI